MKVKLITIILLNLLSMFSLGQNQYSFTTQIWYHPKMMNLEALLSQDTIKFQSFQKISREAIKSNTLGKEKPFTTDVTRYPNLEMKSFGAFYIKYDFKTTIIKDTADFSVFGTSESTLTTALESKFGKWEYKANILKFIYYPINSNTFDFSKLKKMSETNYKIVQLNDSIFQITRIK